MNEYFDRALALAMDGASEDQLSKLADTLLTEKLKAVKKDYKQTATIKLSKKKGKWIIDEFDNNGDFYNALTERL